MPKLTPLSSRQVIKKLKKAGFKGPIPGGRHMHMVSGTTVIPILVHGGKDIAVGLISKIIKECGLTRDQWIEL